MKGIVHLAGQEFEFVLNGSIFREIGVRHGISPSRFVIGLTSHEITANVYQDVLYIAMKALNKDLTRDKFNEMLDDEKTIEGDWFFELMDTSIKSFPDLLKKTEKATSRMLIAPQTS